MRTGRQVWEDSLPEAAGDFQRHADEESAIEEDRTPDILFLTEVFDEFLGNVIESTGTASINVAAGIARNRLRGVE